MGDRRIIPEPPIPRGGEGAMLGEAPPAVAVCLWQYVRHLRDWTGATPAQRAALLPVPVAAWVAEKRRNARAEAAAIAPALDVIETMLRSPESVADAGLAASCDEIAGWAMEQGYGETAIHFAELAASLDREEPRRANLAGRLTRNAGDPVRAEVWLERGIGLARRKRNWVEYTRGHLGLGILWKDQGRVSRARKHFNTASLMAMREGHEWLAAEAQHDLFHFMTVHGDPASAELHARRALAWYPKHHPRIPFLAADIAFLLVCRAQYSDAAVILRSFLRKVKSPQRVLGLSVLVRALAGAGRTPEYERARARLVGMLDVHEGFAAAARWNLAHAERAMGRWDAAEETVRSAIALARAAGDGETAALSETLLEEIERRIPAEAEIRRKDRSHRELMALLTGRLREWAPTRRGRTPSRTRAEWAA